ncbi:translation initiation factor IF-2, mitochondrial-like isoform X2 [Liolophura sinensis]
MISDRMTVAELADAMGKDTDHVFEALMFVEDGDRFEYEDSVINSLNIIQEVVRKSGFRFELKSKKQVKQEENKDVVRQPPPDASVLVKRPPVVTIMGHVDHGKTTLLDYLRQSRVVDQEFGGITQHIGAFRVKLQSGESITFLDTPGHAAFTAMRSRGAKVTDIVVLVVAADDGVMEQTIESIQMAQDAGVSIIVAINKIDKPEADLERTKQGLIAHGIMLEEVGGDVQVVPISALKGTNVSELQEAIITQAELMELKGDLIGLVEGSVVESKTDPGRGKLTTAIIQRGTLKKGSYLVAGTAWAKVRGMFDDQGQPVKEAPPSTAVEMIGWKDLPSAGEEIFQVETEQRVKEIIAWRKNQEVLKKVEEDSVIIADKREEHEKTYKQMLVKKFEMGYRKLKRKGPREKEIAIGDGTPQLSVVVKADVDGSLEAILDTMDTYNSVKCELDLVHYGVGNITETDVELAESFNGFIYGFNVTVPQSIASLAKSKRVSIKLHNVIYKLFDNLIEDLSSQLPLATREDVTGEANLLQVFKVTEGKKKVTVAGCRCTKGSLNKRKKFRIVRGVDIVYEGVALSLKHHKKEVDTVKTDVECGIRFDELSIDIKPGDQVVCYDLEHLEQSIDWRPNF